MLERAFCLNTLPLWSKCQKYLVCVFLLITTPWRKWWESAKSSCLILLLSSGPEPRHWWTPPEASQVKVMFPVDTLGQESHGHRSRDLSSSPFHHEFGLCHMVLGPQVSPVYKKNNVFLGFKNISTTSSLPVLRHQMPLWGCRKMN